MLDNTEAVTHIGLCAGYGGIELGIGRVIPNLRTIALCEIEAYAVANLVAKMEGEQMAPAPIWTNLKTFPWAEFSGKVDILTGGYPCFEAGTQVLTRERGYAPIETIREGEFVLTHTGHWKPVTAVMRKENATTMGVKPTIGTETRCTLEHPYYLRERITRSANSGGHRVLLEPGWVKARDINPEKHRMGIVFPVEATRDTNSAAFWWLTGRYLADGHIVWQRKKGRVVISTNSAKIDAVIEKAREAGLGGCLTNERTSKRLHITRTAFARWCGGFGKRAEGKFIPGWVLGIQPELLRAFVDGYIAGDGYTNKKGVCSFTTVSESLALGMGQCYAKSYNCPFSIRRVRTPDTCVIEGRTVNQRDYFRCSFSNSNRRGINDGSSLWAECHVTREERTGITVYNIAVADDESYIANGVVVHNCQPFSAAGKRQGTEDPRHLWPFISTGIRIMRPRMCFFENVEGHISLGLSAVISDLEEMGYKVAWGIFSAAEVGAPHQRKRVFIMAYCKSDERGQPEAGNWGQMLARGSAKVLAYDNSKRGEELGRRFAVESQFNTAGDDGGNGWPSRPGEPQHGWEPPRVI